MKTIEECIKNNKIRIHVKPNAHVNKILEIDAADVVHIAIAAPATKHKANEEIVKFFTRLLKKKIRIASGLTSKQKVLQVIV